MAFFILKAALRKLAFTEDAIYKADGWEFNKAHEHIYGKIHPILQRIHQLKRENGDEIYRYNLNPDVSLAAAVAATSQDRTKEYNHNHYRIQDLCRLRTEHHELETKRLNAWISRPRNAAT
ncbi:hypothetical protein BDW69DRAFT_188706 [Aspergillus filifer]